jgi:hypothetical protein
MQNKELGSAGWAGREILLGVILSCLTLSSAIAQTADPSWAYCAATSKGLNRKPSLILISRIYTTGGDVNGRVEQRIDYKEFLRAKLQIEVNDVHCYEWDTEANAKRLRALYVRTGSPYPDPPNKEQFEVKDVDWKFGQR